MYYLFMNLHKTIIITLILLQAMVSSPVINLFSESAEVVYEELFKKDVEEESKIVVSNICSPVQTNHATLKYTSCTTLLFIVKLPLEQFLHKVKIFIRLKTLRV
jgi:hypothetical protein